MNTTPAADTATSQLPAQALRAVLWDFDGTLADTEPIWMRAEHALVSELGGVWTDEHAYALVGNDLMVSARYILGVVGRTDLAPEWVVDRLVDAVNREIREGDLPWRPGALELLAALRAHGIPCALVSASYRSTLDAVVDRLPVDTFQIVVAGDEVARGKPDPEPYLRASSLLGVEPSACVVIEDSIPGTSSGAAAGAYVVAVRNHVALPEGPRRVLLDSLTAVTPDVLRELVTASGAGA